MLLIARLEAGEKDFTPICTPVAVAVLGKKMSGAAEMSAPPRQGITPEGNGIPSRNTVTVS